MVIKLNQNSPKVNDKVKTWIGNTIYDDSHIINIENGIIYLENYTYMDMRMYSYMTGKVVATSNKKLRTDEYLPIMADDFIWYSYPTSYPYSSEKVITKVYKCIRLCNCSLGEYEGLSMALYDGGSSLGYYEYFKRV